MLSHCPHGRLVRSGDTCTGSNDLIYPNCRLLGGGQISGSLAGGMGRVGISALKVGHQPQMMEQDALSRGQAGDHPIKGLGRVDIPHYRRILGDPGQLFGVGKINLRLPHERQPLPRLNGRYPGLLQPRLELGHLRRHIAGVLADDTHDHSQGLIPGGEEHGILAEFGQLDQRQT